MICGLKGVCGAVGGGAEGCSSLETINPLLASGDLCSQKNLHWCTGFLLETTRGRFNTQVGQISRVSVGVSGWFKLRRIKQKVCAELNIRMYSEIRAKIYNGHQLILWTRIIEKLKSGSGFWELSRFLWKPNDSCLIKNNLLCSERDELNERAASQRPVLILSSSLSLSLTNTFFL